MFQSTDPNVIGMILQQMQQASMMGQQQIEQLQEADHQMLEQEQDDVLRELLGQMGLLGVATPQAGMAEGADELAVPGDATGIPGMGAPMDISELPPELAAMVAPQEQPVDPMMMMMEAGGEAPVMGMGPTGLEDLSDEELLAILGGAA